MNTATTVKRTPAPIRATTNAAGRTAPVRNRPAALDDNGPSREQISNLRFATRHGIRYYPDHAPNACPVDSPYGCCRQHTLNLEKAAARRPDWHITAAQARAAIRAMQAAGIPEGIISLPQIKYHGPLTPEAIGQIPPGYVVRLTIRTSNTDRLLEFVELERWQCGDLAISIPLPE